MFSGPGPSAWCNLVESVCPGEALGWQSSGSAGKERREKQAPWRRKKISAARRTGNRILAVVAYKVLCLIDCYPFGPSI
jgi:hypothetical protein